MADHFIMILHLTLNTSYVMDLGAISDDDENVNYVLSLYTCFVDKIGFSAITSILGKRYLNLFGRFISIKIFETDKVLSYFV